MRTTRWPRAIMGIFALIVLPGVSMAKDYCINDAPVIFVGQGFAIPAKGKCQPWNGFTPFDNVDSPSAGTGCTSSDGKTFALTITTSSPENGTASLTAGEIIFDSISLKLPGQTGTDTETILGQGSASGPVSGGSCGGEKIPD